MTEKKVFATQALEMAEKKIRKKTKVMLLVRMTKTTTDDKSAVIEIGPFNHFLKKYNTVSKGLFCFNHLHSYTIQPVS